MMRRSGGVLIMASHFGPPAANAGPANAGSRAHVAFDYGDHFFVLDSGRLLHEADSAGAVSATLIEQSIG